MSFFGATANVVDQRDDGHQKEGAAARTRFREDINILRAVAVISVVAYHFHLPTISGGFLGVDVFFVISGYLMTQIITSAFEEGNFNIGRFYFARARRLFPALLVLCLFWLLVGLIFIDPLTYRSLAKDAFSSLLFFSNFMFWRETGYFGPNAATRWLLHSWSLSVEWQFYLLYPVFLVILFRLLGTRSFFAGIAAGFAGSFLLSALLSPSFPTPAFYLLPTRAWELFAGGIVYFAERRFIISRGRASLLEAAGFALIVIPVFIFNASTVWPGTYAIIPVLGTAMVIFSGGGSLTALLGSLGIVGLWSYSLYLWHWPMLVAIRYFELPLDWITILAAITLTIVASGLSYRFIETPVRKWDLSGNRLRLAVAATMILFAFGLSGSAWSLNGLPARSGNSDLMQRYAAATTDWNFPSSCNGPDYRGRIRICTVGGATSGGVLVVGDSHAQQYYPRVAAIAGAQDRIVFATAPACMPLPGLELELPGFHCARFFDQVKQLIAAEGFRRIIVISNWNIDPATGAFSICLNGTADCGKDLAGNMRVTSAAFEQGADYFKALRARGIEVTIVLPSPRSRNNIPIGMAKHSFLSWLPDRRFIGRADFASETEWVRSRIAAMAVASGATRVDPTKFMCEPSACAAVDAKDQPIYIDGNHLRASYAASSVTFLDEYFQQSGAR